MARIQVLWFATLRTLRGCDSELVETGAATAGELLEELRARYSIPLAPPNLAVAINDEFAGWTTALREGDVVAFLPPVSGG